jgi:hypothetical protein
VFADVSREHRRVAHTMYAIGKKLILGKLLIADNKKIAKVLKKISCIDINCLAD